MKMFESNWIWAESAGLEETSWARSLKEPRPGIIENLVMYFHGSEGERLMVVESCFELVRCRMQDRLRKRRICIDLL